MKKDITHLKNTLEKEIERIEKNKKILQIIYYSFGFITIILSVLVTSFTVHDLTQPTFYIAICLNIITTGLNFFKIESKIASMDFDSKQYFQIQMDCEEYILNDQNTDEALLEKLAVLKANQTSLCF